MTQRLKWGVLGVAKIATDKVIPAMQRGERTSVVAIGSRDRAKAERAAAELGIARAHGSYDDVLNDRDVDAVYIPLPNHMHLEWATRAAEAGKHVLCEKPIGMDASEAAELLAVRDRTGVKIQEAFMVRTHPQWTTAKALVDSGDLGELRAMTGVFSYFNDDATNIRNLLECGGGALMDIGCYFVMTSRFIFGREPVRAIASMEIDPEFGTDRLTSMVIDYGGPTFAGTCATQMSPSQRIQIAGTKGRMEIEIPFNAPQNEPAWFTVEGRKGVVERLDTQRCDQYTIQGDRFAAAVLDGTDVVYPLEESVGNMRVIDALFESVRSSGWVDLGRQVGK